MLTVMSDNNVGEPTWRHKQGYAQLSSLNRTYVANIFNSEKVLKKIEKNKIKIRYSIEFERISQFSR
jgi:hypothetical protein